MAGVKLIHHVNVQISNRQRTREWELFVECHGSGWRGTDLRGRRLQQQSNGLPEPELSREPAERRDDVQ